MPNMTREDFGSNVPTNADDIIQHVNNLILYHEEIGRASCRERV